MCCVLRQNTFLLDPGVEMSTGKLSGKLHEMLGGNLANKWHPILGGGVMILLVSSCYDNQNKFWPDGSPGSHKDVTFT